MTDEVNVGDEEQVAKKQRRYKRDQGQELADVGKFLTSYEGRFFVWRMLEHCGIYDCFGPASEAVMGFNEGRRWVGLKILEECLAADPTSEMVMKRENTERQERLKRNG